MFLASGPEPDFQPASQPQPVSLKYVKISYCLRTSIFSKISLFEGSVIYEIKLNLKFDPDLYLPISIAKIDNFFFAGFANGIIIKFDDSPVNNMPILSSKYMPVKKYRAESEVVSNPIKGFK